MSSPIPMAAVTQIVEILTPFSSEEKQRIIAATLLVLGEQPAEVTKSIVRQDILDDGGINTEMPHRALLWLKQNQISMDDVEQIFHIKGTEVDVIAHDIPGKNGKEKTLNAYLLAGIAQLLSVGEPSFDDKSARALCKTAGCYSEANHAAYLKDRGNEISGSKEKGWVLTAPGLKKAASIIKNFV